MSDSKNKTVIALGYFDSVHIGHKEVLNKARDVADKMGATLTVFSFDGNLRAALNLGEGTYIYNAEERTALYKELGAFEVYLAPVNYNFLSTGKLAFLNAINKKYDVCAYVCGEDYKFGKFGKGNVEDIKRYANLNEQKVVIVRGVEMDGKRVSSTQIKKHLSLGEIEKANALLSRDYSVTGEVIKDREVGKSIGFPTANIKIEKGRQTLKDGVYKGYSNIDGKVYKAIINYGARPTYSLNEKLIEAHFIDFDGNLYGKKITLFFNGYMRDIRKFSDEKSLIEQLTKDKAEIKGE